MKIFSKLFAVLFSILLCCSLWGYNGEKEEIKKADITIEETVLPDKTAEKPEALEETPKMEEETTPKSESELVCSIVVDYSDIFEDISSLKKEKQEKLKEGGTILSLNNAEFTEGESVFDVLKREIDKAGISLKYSKMPLGNNVYIEGIDNICEFDCGKSSGWLYSVNGKHPMISSSQYKLKAGDKVHFTYKRKAY